ncbi:MAG TPA: AI-2E family transporter [Chloroflexota bacterium]
MMKQQPDSARRSTLLRLAVVLASLLIVLASLAVLFIFILLLQRFSNVLVLFVLGAIAAYVLNPAVNLTTAMLGKRWAGTLVVYLGVIVVLAILGVLLFQPLITQSSSLVSALNSPSTSSLRVLDHVRTEADRIEKELRAQRGLIDAGTVIPRGRMQQVEADIATLQNNVTALGSPALPLSSRSARSKMAPQAQIRIPPSYLSPLQRATSTLVADYGRAVHAQETSIPSSLTRSISDAGRIAATATALHRTVSGTPILLLDAQTWADQHNIGVNVEKSAGQAIKKATDQAASLLNNTAAILSQTAGLLLDLFLILIISVYFVVDGGRMVKEAVAVVPDAYHKQATSFVSSLDSILGGYIRAQILLALLAGVLGGAGAAVLGVPYAIVIGASTFALQLLPVIGPILVYVVPMVIALLFTSMPTPVLLLVYFIVFEQLVSNVIGPRINSKSVGIHPLEAMAAALVGYPIAGFLGSFLAVPVVGLFHIVARQAYASWKTRTSSSLTGAASTDTTEDEAETLASDGAALPTAAHAGAGLEQ